ncbi:hypothetical protein, partial [Chromobacterium haemolyticum]|uniref:hypothetical protein n=1 Tax=Chromobacterium haemolyticum TaxID=394935 RepID=UPI001EE68B5F
FLTLRYYSETLNRFLEPAQGLPRFGDTALKPASKCSYPLSQVVFALLRSCSRDFEQALTYPTADRNGASWFDRLLEKPAPTRRETGNGQ